MVLHLHKLEESVLGPVYEYPGWRAGMEKAVREVRMGRWYGKKITDLPRYMLTPNRLRLYTDLDQAS
jgi:hypothetical protein